MTEILKVISQKDSTWKIILMTILLFSILMTLYVFWHHAMFVESEGYTPERKISPAPTRYWRDPVTGECYVEKWGKIALCNCEKIPPTLLRSW